MKRKNLKSGYILPAAVAVLTVLLVALIFILSRINGGEGTEAESYSASGGQTASDTTGAGQTESSSAQSASAGGMASSYKDISSNTVQTSSETAPSREPEEEKPASTVSSQAQPEPSRPSPEENGEKYLEISFAKRDKLGRYAEYHKKNPDLGTEQVVVDVNIGLDRDFYTGVEAAVMPGTNLILVNKYHALDSSYVPDELVNLDDECRVPDRSTVQMTEEAAGAFLELSRAARAEGYIIYGCSGYRSYSRQNTIYTNYVNREGQKEADLNSARPGHSEHQTGLAIDVCADEHSDFGNFGNTSSYIWARDNIHKYGFIIHYTEDNTDITGYISEPWHFRYVGKEAASEIYEAGMSYEEYHARGLAG